MRSAKQFHYSTSALFLCMALGIFGLWQARGAAAFFTTNYVFYDKANASDGEADDRFGAAVAVSGDGNTIVIGAPTDDLGVTQDHGSVYVYTRQAGNAVFQQQLLANGNNVQRLGTSVAISGDTIAAGAAGDDSDTGGVYIFVKTGGTWVQTQRLTASDGAPGDYFGQSVSLDGNSLVVGANGDANARGSAYVFVRSGSTWSQQRKLIANDGTGGDLAGFSVAISGDTVALGATGADAGGINNRGAVYLFVRNGTNWLQQQKLVAADAGPNDNLGVSVALDGNTLLAGAFLDSSLLYSNHGSAYVFTRTGTVWSLQDKLGADDLADNDLFGNAVALRGDTALVGAYSKQVGNIASTGRVYVFTRTGPNWSKQQDFTTSNQTGALFGAAVAFASDTIVVGAPRESAHKGGAYIYRPLNHVPTLVVAGPLNRQAGDGITSNVTVATVGDQDQAASALQVTVNGAASATSNGVTLSNLSIGANGVVGGTVQISCSAADTHFTLRVTDDEGAFLQALLVINIGANSAPVLSYSSPQTVNLAGNLTVNPATGPVDNGGIAALQAWGITPSFNGGFTVNAAGVVSLLSAGPAGTYTVTVRATDNCGLIRNATFTLNVTGNCPTINLAPAALNNGTMGTNFNQQLLASGGGGPYTYVISAGALPNGLTLSAAGLLSGTPTAAGSFNFTVRATDLNGCQGMRNYTLTVNQGQPQAQFVKGDFDGDHKADLAVWTGATGNWSALKSSNNAAYDMPWGAGYAPYYDVIVPGDYDGDGKADHAIWRGADSIWYIRKSSDGQAILDLWGANYAPYNDIPAPGDFDGDGRTDLAVFRPTTGTWLVKKSSDGSNLIVQHGQSGDVPLAADFDGDGKCDFGLFRPSAIAPTPNWLIRQSSNNAVTAQQWGGGYAPYFDTPVPADYDGDGKADLAIWRGQDSIWYIRPSAMPNSPVLELWGANYAPYFDIPVPADYDGDGKADIAVWRKDGTWFVKRSATGTYLIQGHGQTGDVPVPATGVR